MKKLIMATVIIMATLFSTNVFASSIPVYFDSKPISMSQKPVIQSGTTLVPFRSIFENLGYSVVWDPTNRTIKADNGKTNMTLTLGSACAYVNGEEKILNIAPKMINRITMVPLRFVSESAGYDVKWNDESRYITIGDVDQDLVDIYEKASTYYPIESGAEVIRFDDLYTVEGTGEYAGYKKLMGHPYSKTNNIYYQLEDDGESFYYYVEDINYNPNEKITWYYEGKHVDTKGDIYELLNEADKQYTVDRDTVNQYWGNIYDDWNSRKQCKIEAGDLTGYYIYYKSGNAFNDLYQQYLTDNQSDNQSNKYEPYNTQTDVYDQQAYMLDDFNLDDWISGKELREKYDVNTLKMGSNTVFFTEEKGQIFEITKAPYHLEDGKIYEEDGVRYMKMEPLSPAGITNVNDYIIIYYIPDLKSKGIIN